MVKISVIIVNYNVKHFLEQCLISVFKALGNINSEIFVVDNDSVDGSCSMIKEKFPKVKLIENKKNQGFSFANNQAIKIASGQYILLLNPDTVVEEDSFEKCIQFMDSNFDAGALTVKMIDGKGRFLPESKRALPTPLVAFYKIFGLTRLFPKSKKIARYYLGHLNNDKTNEIEILPGAFMFLRSEVLEKTGLLDEDYFMYGEDIDLSYRITKSGYKNYYFPETTIIHYKGESTKKGSINYVYVFYNAMIIFARKHFSTKNAKAFSLLINIAVYFRALMALISRFVKNAFLPLLDVITIFYGFYLIKPIWEMYKLKGQGQYPKEFLLYAVPSYILIWILSIWINAGYSKQIKMTGLLKGVAIGTLIILAAYALLPESYRYSRALILIGGVVTLAVTFLNRLLVHYINFLPQKFKLNRKLRIISVGLIDEVQRVEKIIIDSEIKPRIVGYVAPSLESQKDYHLGTINQLKEIIKIHKINEIVFCAKDITSNQIIASMLQLSDFNIDYKIAQPDTLSIIGSNSIETAGELYTVELNAISKNNNIRDKRFFDISTSILILIFCPLILLFSKIPFKLINNSFKVLLGLKTWVGYYKKSTVNVENFPKIKEGILTPLDLKSLKEPTVSFINKSNMVYAKNYTIWNDLNILLKGFKQIGR
ncbi:MAG: glycosyltransferase family 2 protein [Bacteroidales bacterium]|jgi:GT2 family glycosyltransferase|nr:glycosyltransferase family 2 protein [Bacteroidales bacterium]